MAKDDPRLGQILQLFPDGSLTEIMDQRRPLTSKETETLRELLIRITSFYNDAIREAYDQAAGLRDENQRIRNYNAELICRNDQDVTDSLEMVLKAESAADRAMQKNRSLLDRIAAQEATIEQLTYQSMTDGMTGLLNKRAYDETLGDELKRAERFGTTLSLIMLDGDHFKQVNDNYGHLVGDEVIKGMARVMKANTRVGVDKLGRFGGEEFAIILPETDSQGAQYVAEKIRAALKAAPLYEDIGITASFGVATYDPAIDTDISRAIRNGMTDIPLTETSNKYRPQDVLAVQADRALYNAKETRDCVKVCRR